MGTGNAKPFAVEEMLRVLCELRIHGELQVLRAALKKCVIVHIHGGKVGDEGRVWYHRDSSIHSPLAMPPNEIQEAHTHL
jgi:hypothetical protein